MQRRNFLWTLAGAPALVCAQSARPAIAQGIQIGDVTAGRAVVWSRSDRAARLMVEWAANERMQGARRVRGPVVAAGSDFTGRVEIAGLPPGAELHLRAWFEEPDAGRARSEPVPGRLRTPGTGPVRFFWSGDTCGQGYGINRDWGGMRIYETMRKLAPDFFLHSGDTIYADNPIAAELKTPDGTVWKNVVTAAKSKVAETLDEFSGNYLYNLLDDNVRRFGGEVPQIWQWDDHEVLNNWSPGKDLSGDGRYREKDIRVLVPRARQAFLEYAPLRLAPRSAPRIYRKIGYGPLLDVFVVDQRTYRGPNTFNRQEAEGPDTVYMGRRQVDWLAADLKASTAAWKVIAADMPIGLIVGDGKDEQGRPRFENVANGGGPALGRELELARLLRELKRRGVRNVVWLTADTHYTAAHYYDPAKARFTDFDPFWEFVSGPLNAGTFGPNPLDDTFGPQVRYFKAPPPGQSNLAPSAGMQFFGEVAIDARTREMTVNLRDLEGQVLHTELLAPA